MQMQDEGTYLFGVTGATLALQRATEVIHNHVSASRCKEQSICFSKSSPSTCDNDRLSIETEGLSGHVSHLFKMFGRSFDDDGEEQINV